jgi:hypothetical protein
VVDVNVEVEHPAEASEQVEAGKDAVVDEAKALVVDDGW